MQGRDTLAVLPTGGGKSLCFQIPTLARPGICIVITPLISLMKDQVDHLRRKGIKAAGIYSGLTRREIDIVLDNCAYGDYKFLYVSPERLKTEIFVERIQKMQVSLIAVDEAHCISQWGYDFRPTYLEIRDFRALLPQVSVVALTASATPAVSKDIQEKLAFDDGLLFQASFARKNLSFVVRKVEDKDRKLLGMLSKVAGTAIVYVYSRKRTQDLSRMLVQHGVSADYYHAGLSNEKRSKKQDNWQRGHTRVMVATNAFGMGIDKSDVRLVIHYDMPDNVESYYQEAGRAGRDGRRAYAAMLYHPGDAERLKKSLEVAFPTTDLLRKVYQAVANYYKLAVGSNRLSSFDFDLQALCETYKLKSHETYHTLKKLQEEGLIDLNESFFNPSKVHIALPKDKLYEYQIANPKADVLIKALLRLYGGELFTNYLPIAERDIARLTNTTALAVTRLLEQLDELGVLYFQKIKDKPQLTFITARYDANKLPLDVARMRARKNIREHMLQSMLDYAELQEGCRTMAILHYFGEENANFCGQCDLCIARKKKLRKVDVHACRSAIMKALGNGSLDFDALSAQITNVQPDDLKSILRLMLDAGDLAYDDLGKIVAR